MAILQINTQSAQYQTRLAQFDQIIDFYKPIIKTYYDLRTSAERAAWRQRDPILRRFLRIHEAIEKLEEF